MSFGVIIASHGGLAEGMKDSLDLVFGQQENTAVVSFLEGQKPEDVKVAYQKAIAAFDEKAKEVLILVDLWGGTPFNQANLLAAEQSNIGIISGLSLPLAIQAFTERLDESKSLATAMANMVREGRAGIKIPEHSIQAEGLAAGGQRRAQQPQSNEPFQINLVRIDSRLLHGQVATAWTPDSKANRIIVVSDAVAKDEVRKKLIMQAAPPGVKANVVPIKKMIEAAKSPMLNGVHALLLFENPQDLLKVIEGGVKIPVINVGQMVNSIGKTQISHTLSLDKADVATFEKLRELGTEFDVRKVPSDSKQNLFALIEKADIK